MSRRSQNKEKRKGVILASTICVTRWVTEAPAGRVESTFHRCAWKHLSLLSLASTSSKWPWIHQPFALSLVLHVDWVKDRQISGHLGWDRSRLIPQIFGLTRAPTANVLSGKVFPNNFTITAYYQRDSMGLPRCAQFYTWTSVTGQTVALPGRSGHKTSATKFRGFFFFFPSVLDQSTRKCF